jgi:hypothetical protein
MIEGVFIGFERQPEGLAALLEGRGYRMTDDSEEDASRTYENETRGVTVFYRQVDPDEVRQTPDWRETGRAITSEIRIDYLSNGDLKQNLDSLAEAEELFERALKLGQAMVYDSISGFSHCEDAVCR